MNSEMIVRPFSQQKGLVSCITDTRLYKRQLRTNTLQGHNTVTRQNLKPGDYHEVPYQTDLCDWSTRTVWCLGQRVCIRSWSLRNPEIAKATKDQNN